MKDNMTFVEGTYRLAGRDWEVFIFFADRSITVPDVRTNQRWESGVTGIYIGWPRGDRLNKDIVQRLLSEHLGVTEWEEVRGPDSLQIR